MALKDVETHDDPNYKFRKISEDARAVVNLTVDLYILYREATRDGITAEREMLIKGYSKRIEAAARRLREPVKIYKPEIVSKCEHCGHTVWRDD
jgi:hypothetical protein